MEDFSSSQHNMIHTTGNSQESDSALLSLHEAILMQQQSLQQQPTEQFQDQRTVEYDQVDRTLYHLSQQPQQQQQLPKPKKRYPCKFEGCDRDFSTSGHLTRHMKIHLGEKNHICPILSCHARFSRKDNMMQHYSAHQKKLLMNREPIMLKPTVQLISTGRNSTIRSEIPTPPASASIPDDYRQRALPHLKWQEDQAKRQQQQYVDDELDRGMGRVMHLKERSRFPSVHVPLVPSSHEWTHPSEAYSANTPPPPSDMYHFQQRPGSAPLRSSISSLSGQSDHDASYPYYAGYPPQPPALSHDTYHSTEPMYHPDAYHHHRISSLRSDSMPKPFMGQQQQPFMERSHSAPSYLLPTTTSRDETPSYLMNTTSNRIDISKTERNGNSIYEHNTPLH
jgi:hypothetical protein